MIFLPLLLLIHSAPSFVHSIDDSCKRIEWNNSVEFDLLPQTIRHLQLDKFLFQHISSQMNDVKIPKTTPWIIRMTKIIGGHVYDVEIQVFRFSLVGA